VDRRLQEETMRVLAFAAGVVLTVAGLTVGGAAQSKELKGTLMDIACSSHHATEAGYTEKHDKKCLLLTACVKSGYSLVTADKKVLNFDAKGNEMTLDFIKKTDHDADWKVTVNGTVSGDTIAVTNIKMQ
jgi:hypothetical protein